MAKKFDLAKALTARRESMLANDVLEKILKTGKLERAEELPNVRIPTISTGFGDLDFAIGGGFAIGGMTILHGLENSCKTTVFLKAIANAQEMCFTCYRHYTLCECGEDFKACSVAIIDVEGSMSMKWLSTLGVRTDAITYIRPANAEEALSLIDQLVETNEVDIIMLDSIAALEPENELDMDYSKSVQPGTLARLCGIASRKMMARNNLQARNEGHKTTFFFTNQIRMKIGVMYGSPETNPGGKSWDYFTNLRIRLRGEAIKDDKTKEIIATKVHFMVQKTKFPVVGEGTFNIQLIKTETKNQGAAIDEENLRMIAENFGFFTRDKAKWTLALLGMDPWECKKRDDLDTALRDPVFKATVVQAMIRTVLKMRTGEDI